MADKVTENSAPATTEEVSDLIAGMVETAIRNATSGAGPIAAPVINLIVSQAVRPIVDTLAAIVGHIGMAVPAALGELVEKLESGVGFDINGDGFVGDPEAK